MSEEVLDSETAASKGPDRDLLRVGP